MTQSLFVEYVHKYFPGLVLAISERVNDTSKPLKYLHLRLLEPDYSPTGTWDSVSSEDNMVMADVVSMDSPLPLKRRDSLKKASGEIPKLGMKMQLNERQLTDLQLIMRQNGRETQLAKKLFADTSKCIVGIYERNEAIFLEALSTGLTVIDDDNNVGLGVRVDYGYLPENKFESEKAWSSRNTTMPFTDIKRVLKKASDDGNDLTLCIMDDVAFDGLADSQQMRELYSFITSNPTQFTFPLDEEQVKLIFQRRFKLDLWVIKRSVKSEKNGVRTTHRPWSAGMVVFLPSENAGRLVWSTLAEKDHPVGGVSYETSDNFILVSKYGQNDPLRESTSSQARVIPVISGVDKIYTLNTNITS